ncbi:MAG: hypothetical protein FWG68_12775 [Defluviitaleaceae bacterium]|nr:hypothetical protein [Defluviitaleaceae bacterium]
MEKVVTEKDLLVYPGTELLTEDEMFDRFEHHWVMLRWEKYFDRKYPGYEGFLAAAIPKGGDAYNIIEDYMEKREEEESYAYDYLRTGTYPSTKADRWNYK